jgi:hypothetical protein
MTKIDQQVKMELSDGTEIFIMELPRSVIFLAGAEFSEHFGVSAQMTRVDLLELRRLVDFALHYFKGVAGPDYVPVDGGPYDEELPF